ncbi:MAG: VOC family protein [Kiloniellales bacterium]|nr:VOC family protein [Kiloniellales bacterium]
MHRSRLGGFIIDCRTEDLDAAAEFWSQALGYPTFRHDDPAEADYVQLRTDPEDLQIEVQKVDHESRVHLDIETDDEEAEARRLEGLGAKRVAKVRGWLVMEAPTGQRFCLVNPQRAAFEAEANLWD